MLGHEDRTSGHLSWRDPAGRGLWIKRSRFGMDEAWSACEPDARPRDLI
jgi:hypothetical protein